MKKSKLNVFLLMSMVFFLVFVSVVPALASFPEKEITLIIQAAP